MLKNKNDIRIENGISRFNFMCMCHKLTLTYSDSFQIRKMNIKIYVSCLKQL